MLTQQETQQLSKLLKKINKPHDGLPEPIFKVLTKLLPFVACELVIKNKQGILLTWRDDQFWTDWHFPGGLLRFSESFEERIKKVAQAELGVRINSIKFLFPLNYPKSPRGHDVSLVFLCATNMMPTAGRFFKTMPKDIIEVHKELWKKVKTAR